MYFIRIVSLFITLSNCVENPPLSAPVKPDNLGVEWNARVVIAEPQAEAEVGASPL